MKAHRLTFRLGALLSKQQGGVDKAELNATLDLSDSDFELAGQVTGEVQFLKLPHEINVQIRNLQVELKSSCKRCLQPFTMKIRVPMASREFIIDLPERDLMPNEDVFYLEKGSNDIDLTDMVREEILLHFPFIPICSDGCKGLCDRCGEDLNVEKCTCSRSHSSSNSLKAFIPNLH